MNRHNDRNYFFLFRAKNTISVGHLIWSRNKKLIPFSWARAKLRNHDRVTSFPAAGEMSENLKFNAVLDQTKKKYTKQNTKFVFCFLRE